MLQVEKLQKKSLKCGKSDDDLRKVEEMKRIYIPLNV